MAIREGIWPGDAGALIKRVPSGCVDLIVTSVPYPGRRGGVHPDEFVAWCMPFADEFWRVLRSTGSLVLNVREPCVNGERHTCVLNLILAMRYKGWMWVEEYCWHKRNTSPGRWPNRLRDGWERCLHFTKSTESEFYDEQVMIPIGGWSKGNRRNVNDMVRTESGTGAPFAVCRANWHGKDMVFPSNVLHFAAETRNVGHPRAFPEKLPEFFIKLLTKEDDLVFDPFLGSGTTAVVARRLGRRFIGFEQERRYVEVARRRVQRG